jgi:4-amino-4-deoxy-L-arabinose transferase-like glycosyltransferase
VPAGAVVAYVEAVHSARWLMALLIAIGLVALGVSLVPRWRRRIAHRREIFLLVGMAVSILVGTVATTNPMVRYLVPLAPLLICGGLLAARDLLGLHGRAGRAGRSTLAEQRRGDLQSSPLHSV